MLSGRPSSNAVRFLGDREWGRRASVAEFMILTWDYCGLWRAKMRYTHRKFLVKSGGKVNLTVHMNSYDEHREDCVHARFGFHDRLRRTRTAESAASIQAGMDPAAGST